MDLQGYSNRDKSIINANPGKSPYELKELGLSEKGFNRMLEGGDAENIDEPEISLPGAEGAEEVENEKSLKEENTNDGEQTDLRIEVKKIGPKAQHQNFDDGPIVTQLNAAACIVENLKTGKRVRMSLTAARLLNTREYKIVSNVN